jgi:TRAP-type C4-dicarboxylate transport system permease small subunit
MKKFFSKIELGISIVLGIVRWPAAIALLLMAFLTTIDVIGRYVFLSPIMGNSEIQEVMMVIVIFLGAGYATLKARHANADIIVARLSKKSQAVLGSVTWFLCAVIFGLISWQITKWGWGEIISPTRVSMLLLIKQGPFILVAAFGCIAICLGSLVNFFHSIGQARAKQEGS